MRPVLELVGRQGCHLCDEAESRLQWWARVLRIDLVQVSVDDGGEQAALGERVPVVRLGGDIVAEGPISALAAARVSLRARLRWRR